MLRRVFAWCLPLILIVLCAPSAARAEIPVCVRLPGHPKMDRFALSGSATVITKDWAVFTAKTNGLTVFVYRPDAPPENVRFLPPPYNKLRCPAPPPRPMPAPAKDAPKAPAEESKEGAATSAEAPEPRKPTSAKDEQVEAIPPGVKKMPERPPEKPRPSPPPPEGVLSSEPLLPSESTLPKRDEVHPPKCLDEHCTLVDRGGALPERVFRPGTPVSSVASCEQTKEGCDGEGKGKDSGDKKEDETELDKLAQQLALAAGLAEDPSHDIHRKDGKKHGIVGGEDPDGFNHPALQAAVAFLQLSALAKAQVLAFDAKLKEAGRKKLPVVIKNAEELSKEAIEYLRKKYGKKRLAGSLADMEVIGPYEVMSQFTDGLGGSYQAHHILEEAIARDWGITKELDKIPAVILTEAKHKEITGRLKDLTPSARSVKELWKHYQKAYADYPRWLEAIKPYFSK